MRSWIENTLRWVGERTRIPFAVRYPEGVEQRTTDATPEFTLVFRTARAYWRMAAFGYVGLLEAYFDREVDIEGSLAKALAAGMEGGIDQRGTPFTWIRNRWHELVHSNAERSQAQRNANFHYALTPEFYKLWLDDPLMLYTCAYWKDGTRTLEEAQRNKCDHVAQKLLLQPGEEVVDVGSGFGGFMFHAQERYGVKVTAINTTGSQAEHARREIERRRGVGRPAKGERWRRASTRRHTPRRAAIRLSRDRDAARSAARPPREPSSSGRAAPATRSRWQPPEGDAGRDGRRTGRPARHVRFY
jgi:cyclopropane-fatty-acyl-phospholipid synthase